MEDPMIEELLAGLCVHCSDPLEEPGPDGERDAVVRARRLPGYAHGACEWQDRLVSAGAA